MASTEVVQDIYPEIEPYDSGKLKVSSLHEIYYEQSGKKNGLPIISIHGGPGAASNPGHRRFFDPSVYRIIIFDQRGCGNSTPPGELQENTTWELLEDIEKLRRHLEIEKWLVFGGSWGSTLSLLYAEKYTERVRALIVYGVYTFRRRELMWLYQDGANRLFPDAWEKYLKPIPQVERGDLLSAYYRRLTSDNEEVRVQATRGFQGLENSLLQLYPSNPNAGQIIEPEECDLASQQSSLIECHYSVNGAFLEWDNQILDNAKNLKDIPGIIVQGRYDCICPMESAWMLHKAWTKAEFVIVPDAGHSRRDRNLAVAIILATDKFRTL